MNHRVSLKKLNKTPAHRKAMIRNMLVALFRNRRIKTTLAKAKVLRSFAERLITRARKDGVHNRRIACKWVQDKEILNKLFIEIGPQYMQRTGGYTRIVKIGPRYGDASEMAYIALVSDEDQQKSKKQVKRSSTTRAENKLSDKKVSASEELKENLTHTDMKKSEESDDKKLNTKNDKASKADDHSEHKVYPEQRKQNKSMHSNVAIQKTNMPNTVQQKAQRYRSDKSK